MKIAILGTRGIPNFYGGFEQFAEYVSVGLAAKGHEVYVYNSHDHPYKESSYKGVNLIHKYDAECRLGTAGQFIYDLNCILDSRARNFDVILQLGYTSSSVWGKLLPKNSKIVTNMDGLEWKRSKYSSYVQSFLKKAEKWAIHTSHAWVADSVGIQQHLKTKFNVDSCYIPYGAEVFQNPDESCIKEKYKLLPNKYNLLVARLEPENNIEMILDGHVSSRKEFPFVVIGKHKTKYGEFLKEKYKPCNSIKFIGGVYNQDELSSIRYYSNLYFHGHSVGGTNPSLLEAMACNTLMCYHDNVFNKSIVGDDGFTFRTKEDVCNLIDGKIKAQEFTKCKNNIDKIKEKYSWDTIVSQYESFLEKSLL